MKSLICILVLLLLLGAALFAQTAQPWKATDASGAGVSSGGAYLLTSSFGQPLVGSSTTLSSALGSGFLYVRRQPFGGGPAIIAQPSLGFGLVNVGSSAEIILLIQNGGTADLVLTDVTISPAVGFSAQKPSFPYPIMPGGSLSVPVRFAPSSAGATSATLSIASNAENAPVYTVSLTGTGVSSGAPRLSLSHTTIDFGSVPPNTPVERSFVITNTGTAPLVLDAQTVSGIGFTITAQSSSPLAPNGGGGVTITFQPSATGSYTGLFVVRSNDPLRPIDTVRLSGSCVSGSGPRIALGRTLLDFDSAAIGATKELSLDVRNIGTGDLILSQQTITGTDAADFAITQASASPIAGGASSSVTVRLRGMTTGPKLAMLRLFSNDPGQPIAEAVLVAKVVTETEHLPSLPTGIVLHRAYPNPFSSTSLLEYETDRAGLVQVEIVDLLGRRVVLLEEGMKPAGVYRLRVSAASLVPGHYRALLTVSRPDQPPLRRVQSLVVTGR